MNEITTNSADALIRSWTASYDGLSALKLIDEMVDVLDFFGYTAHRHGLWLETEEGHAYRFYRHPTGWEVRSWAL